MNPKKPKHCYFNYATCQRKYYGYKYHKGIGYECDWYISKGGGFKKCCDGKDPYYTKGWPIDYLNIIKISWSLIYNYVIIMQCLVLLIS